MAIMATSSSLLQFSNPFPSTISKTHFYNHHQQQQKTKKHQLSFITRALDPETTDSKPEPSSSSSSSSEPDAFENRLSQVRLKYRSGTGKKAEVRKGKKPKKGSSSTSGGGNVFLPPVPLKEPVSGGLKVEFGFTPYTERLNGRIAGLGLLALVLVELASGKSVAAYHSPSIVFIQIYFIATVTALYVKFEKEKISVWPQ